MKGNKGLDVLLLLQWGLDKFMRPTFRNWTEPRLDMEYEKLLRDRLRYLQQRQLLKVEERAAGMVYRLTQQGRLETLGGRDPVAFWGRPWDGRWRIMLFDLPERCQLVRQRLLRWLRQNGFGYLQDSVWIRPDAVSELAVALEEFRDDVESLTLLEAGCCAGYSDEAIVRGAWNFEEINRRYRKHMDWLGSSASREPLTKAGLLGWLRQERSNWLHAMSLDPLLPRTLWPKGYLGEKVWQAREKRVRDFVSAAGSTG